jgi:hypothetical protein
MPNTSTKDHTPLTVWEVLAQEYEETGHAEVSDLEYRALADRYKTEQDKARARADDKGQDPQFEKVRCAAEYKFRDALVMRLHKAKTTAICFSGGGIRSATFSLGILQELARRSDPAKRQDKTPGILSQLDYLSTVSGGGYLGAWFSSWLTRQAGTMQVIGDMAAAPMNKIDPEPQQVSHLRQFSAYLTPQLGLLSADTWTIGATVVRNIILNWLVLFPALVCVLAIPQLVRAVNLIDGSDAEGKRLLWIGLSLAAIAVVYVLIDLPSARDARQSQKPFLIFNLLPLTAASLLISIYFAWSLRRSHYESEILLKDAIGYPVGVLIIAFICGLVAVYWKEHTLNWTRCMWAAICSVFTGTVVGGIAYALANGLSGVLRDNPALYTTLAMPSVFAVLNASTIIFVGLSSHIATDDDREWWARAGAWLVIIPMVWLVFSGLVLHGPDVIHLIRIQAIGTGFLGALASWLGFSPKTSSGRRNGDKEATSPPWTDWLRELAIKLAIPAFLVFLAILVGSVSRLMSEQICEVLFRYLPKYAQDVYSWGLLSVSGLVAAYVFGNFVNPNTFSLHAMYRARLIRAYLGASNLFRRPNLFTGFDPADNLSMHQLRPGRPLHVVNMALNLVATDNLAWQQRKAESFTATRLHCGSFRLGYQPSAEYGHPGGMTLGGAITISGAAASPNMGYHSSPTLSLIMTLFNARLGAWLANPGLAGKTLWDKAGPTNAVRPFIDEAFGLTNDKNAWVYLSDGGHFENLGIYEMVLRRCHTIIVVDASSDPGFAFEDLGNAIRKIRIDLGVPIEFPQGISIAARGANGRHCAKGEIQYRCVDPLAENGVLIYIKPSLNGNEPPDVTQYASQHSSFPHQTTANQWFNESQLESYRRLGAHIIEEICALKESVSISEFCEQVERYLWYPSPTVASQFTRHAEAYDRLIERLRQDPNLSALDRALFPNLKRDFGSDLGNFLRSLNPLNDQQQRSVFLFCNSLIQLMENVFLDLRLEDNETDPDNAGWLRVFQNWANSEHFKGVWNVSSDTYGMPFRKFCERRFGLKMRE